MEYKVEIYIQHQDDESVVHPLVDFFRPVASTTVRKEEKLHYKEWHEAIQVVLNVVGVWAAKRYILDPLADKLEDWISAIHEVWTRSCGQVSPLVDTSLFSR